MAYNLKYDLFEELAIAKEMSTNSESLNTQLDNFRSFTPIF